MKFCRFNYSFFLLLCIVVTACIEPYPPPASDGEVDFLVVDGSVNAEDGTASVILSRAVPLASTQSSPPELNAQVILEDNDGNSYVLNEVGDGRYQQSSLLIDNTKEYRLYIITSDNNQYQSDFITIKETPPIDSVTWAPTRNRDGIDIFVNTHDDSKNSRYYQWSYEETYEYEAVYYCYSRLEGEEVVSIPEEQRNFICWRTLPSQKILIGSSERLNDDIIYHFPITTVPKGSQKMMVKYSILVKQKALTREAYDYWLNLQKTTENLGSLFDPQPGQVNGNIHNLTNSKPVLGYFDVGAAQEKRIFIKATEVPQDIRSFKSPGICRIDTVAVEDLPNFDNNANALLDPVGMPFTVAYTFTSTPCVDCRSQSGTTTKPPFWE